MEKVSCNGKAAEMRPFDITAGCVFFPVRHHSPVCSYQLLRAAREYRPEVILIEGPEEASELIPVLTDELTQLPAALYCYYKDTKKLISDEGADHKCYYPFLYSSPEYNAMQAAKELGVEARFIDLPYYEILINTASGRGLRRGGKQSYADDSRLAREDLYSKLCDKTKVRSFDEFWEKYFEISGLALSAEDFIGQMFAYCSFVRELTPAEELEADGTLVRERYMAANIRKAIKEHKRVMVVTGGFHTPGLMELIITETKASKLHKIPSDSTGCFPAAYSYEAADALHGYASGMRYPYFYDSVFKRLRSAESHEGIYESEALSLLIRTAKECSERDLPVSTADIAAAKSLMTGLAALRGVRECGMAEVFDGVTSAFIKGEKTISSSLPLDILTKLATGDGVGMIGDKTHTPPLVADFEKQCAQLRLKNNTAIPQEITCGLFTTAKGLKISRFLHRMDFLETSFCKMVKGPDLRHGRDRNRVREEWRYRRSPAVDSALIDHTTDGFTIEDACKNIASRIFRTEQRIGKAAGLAVDCFLMGIGIDSEAEQLAKLTSADGDFFSVGEAMGHFRTLLALRELYECEDESLLQLLGQCFDKLVFMLPSMANAVDELADQLCRIMRQLCTLADTLFTERRDMLEAALEELTLQKEKHPAVYGAAMGLLCASDAGRQRDAEAAMRGYLNGTIEVKKQGADYLKGLFSTARDIVFAENDFLKLTDELLTGMSSEDFIEILPSMRLAFSYFTPQEISETAEAVACLYGAEGDTLLYDESVDEGLLLFGRQLDREIAQAMEVSC